MIRGVEFASTRGSEFSLTLTPRSDEDLVALFTRLSTLLKELDAEVLKLSVFGLIKAHAAGTEALRRVFGKPAWPMNWVEGASGDKHPIAGLQVNAITGANVDRIESNGRVVGSVFEDGAARHCLLAGILPQNVHSSRADQARQTLENLEAALARGGFSLADAARTWFFNDQLLAWYREFNQVRTALYSRIHFRSGSLPASTGVAGRNPASAALTLDAWAVKPLNLSQADSDRHEPAHTCREMGRTYVRCYNDARIIEVPSPLQGPAPAYGSSFSRAMEIVSGGIRRVLISGTASIAPDGSTVHVGDVNAQIALTMEVVEAILKARDMSLGDVCRATAYFKSAKDTPVFAGWLARHELRSLPVINVCCDICRDDLLFELEADAWKLE
jgi:enamine deaminase RidA (YjgF/YER057c/UK114 family)